MKNAFITEAKTEMQNGDSKKMGLPRGWGVGNRGIFRAQRILKVVKFLL